MRATCTSPEYERKARTLSDFVHLVSHALIGSSPESFHISSSWMEGHTGGSRSIPTVHPCSQSGRRLWVARKALHLHEPNHKGNGRSTHNMVAELDTFHSSRSAHSPVPSETPWQYKLEFSTDKISDGLRVSRRHLCV